MLDLFRGVAVRVVLLTFSIVLVPLFAVLIWRANSGAWDEWPGTQITPWQAGGVIGAIAAAFVVVSLVLSFQHVKRVTDLILPALNALVVQSERIQEGVKPKVFHTTGVAEIDQLSVALGRGTTVASKRLAAERDFAADASHQLRTPLTALLMRLEEIASTDDLDVVAEESAIAIAQVERLSSVVDDLLARSRTGADQAPSISLDSVLASMQREWQPTFAAQRRTINVTGARGLRVQAAPGALAQILSTLLENSLKHGGGTVRVAARRSGPSVVLEVSDQGEGIPASLAPHIFERSVSSTGSGLGLALARDLAASQGGRLELVSAQGALFALFLAGSHD